MLYEWMRVLHSDNGTIADLSLANQDVSQTLALDLVKDEDYIYLGQHYPFNNFFIQMDTVNSIAGEIEIEYWAGEGNGWKSAVDVLDGTSLSGVPLAQSGVIQFSPETTYKWHMVSDTKKSPAPDDLENEVTIYNVYWLRFRYSETPTVGADAKRIFYAFTRSQQLDDLDTTINEFMDSFESGKTNWDDEIITASRQVVQDLRRRGLIIHPGQILRFDDVSYACDLKTLILIYENLGPGFREKLEDRRKQYENALSLRRFSFDKHEDAFLHKNEINASIAHLVR